MPQNPEVSVQERQFIQRVLLNQDQEAFEQLILLHQSSVRSFLRRLCNGNPTLADDLAQDSFLHAFLHLASYRGEGRFLNWLFKIAYQRFVLVLRRHKPTQDLESHSIPDPRTQLQPAQDARLTLGQLLPHLGKEQRAALVLHYQYGLTHTEIAEAVGLPLGTVKTHLLRGKETLLNLASQKTNRGIQ